MFADTITLSINSVNKVLNRVNQDNYSSEYLLKETDGEFRMRLRNSSYVDKARGVKVDRHNVEVIHTVYPVSPATTPIIRKTYSVFENDVGDTLTTVVKEVKGTVDFHSETNIGKLLNWES